MNKVHKGTKLYLVGASWCGACKPAFKMLADAGWPVDYLDIESADHLRIPPSLPQLVIVGPEGQLTAVGPSVSAMKQTLNEFFPQKTI